MNFNRHLKEIQIRTVIQSSNSLKQDPFGKRKGLTTRIWTTLITKPLQEREKPLLIPFLFNTQNALSANIKYSMIKLRMGPIKNTIVQILSMLS